MLARILERDRLAEPVAEPMKAPTSSSKSSARVGPNRRHARFVEPLAVRPRDGLAADPDRARPAVIGDRHALEVRPRPRRGREPLAVKARGEEIGEIADCGRQLIDRLAHRHEDRSALPRPSRARGRRHRGGCTSLDLNADAAWLPSAIRGLSLGPRREGGLSARPENKPGLPARGEIEDLVADRDAALPPCRAPPEDAERQILEGKIGARQIGRLDEAATCGVVRRVGLSTVLSQGSRRP